MQPSIVFDHYYRQFKRKIKKTDTYQKLRVKFLEMKYGDYYVPLSEVRLALNRDTAGMVSRFREWLLNPDKIYPFSCTNVVAQDTYDDRDLDCPISEFETINGTRRFFSNATKGGAGCSIHLRNLRPKGTVNSNGLESQGPANFVQVFSALNNEVCQGNRFKRGACLLYLDMDHPDLLEFIGQLNWEIDEKEHPGTYRGVTANEIPRAKRAVMVTEKMWQELDDYSKVGFLRALNLGDIFVGEIEYDRAGNRLDFQVCNEIQLKSRSTCALHHVNLAAITQIENLPSVYMQEMRALIGIRQNLDLSDTQYLPQDEDRQVGMGVIGLANLLAKLGIKYSEFFYDLSDLLDIYETNGYELALEKQKSSYVSEKLAAYFIQAFAEAADFAENAGVWKCFTIAPTANSSTKYVDKRDDARAKGVFGVAAEISPPVGYPDTKKAFSVGEADKDIEIQYPPDIELAHYDVSFDEYSFAVDTWQRLMKVRTASHKEPMDHGISFNLWVGDCVVDKEFFEKFLDAPKKSLYYRWKVNTTDAAKTSIQLDEEDIEVWDVADGDVSFNDLFSQIDAEEEAKQACGVNDGDSGSYCSACGDA